jgi:hypothetical protein
VDRASSNLREVNFTRPIVRRSAAHPAEKYRAHSVHGREQPAEGALAVRTISSPKLSPIPMGNLGELRATVTNTVTKLRGTEVNVSGGLITQRSQVQILPPQQTETKALSGESKALEAVTKPVFSPCNL